MAAVTRATFPSRFLPELGAAPPDKARSPARPITPHIAPLRPTAFALRGEGREEGPGALGGSGGPTGGAAGGRGGGKGVGVGGTGRNWELWGAAGE